MIGCVESISPITQALGAKRAKALILNLKFHLTIPPLPLLHPGQNMCVHAFGSCWKMNYNSRMICILHESAAMNMERIECAHKLQGRRARARASVVYSPGRQLSFPQCYSYGGCIHTFAAGHGKGVLLCARNAQPGG